MGRHTSGTRHGRLSGRALQRMRAEVAATEAVCWLCGQPIDYELRFPHPDSFEIDHVHPASLGGSSHDRSNYRAAHRRCNNARGNGAPDLQRPRSRNWIVD